MKQKSENLYKKFLNRLKTETIYFINEYQSEAIKSVPGFGYFIKLPNEDEFEAKSESKLIKDAILNHKEISEDEYNNF